MEGGRSLYFSAPFGSFIPQWLGFIGGSFNNKGSTFEMKSSCVCVGRPPFFFCFKMVISRTRGENWRKIERIHQRERGEQEGENVGEGRIQREYKEGK